MQAFGCDEKHETAIREGDAGSENDEIGAEGEASPEGEERKPLGKRRRRNRQRRAKGEAVPDDSKFRCTICKFESDAKLAVKYHFICEHFVGRVGAGYGMEEMLWGRRDGIRGPVEEHKGGYLCISHEAEGMERCQGQKS